MTSDRRRHLPKRRLLFRRATLIVVVLLLAALTIGGYTTLWVRHKSMAGDERKLNTNLLTAPSPSQVAAANSKVAKPHRKRHRPRPTPTPTAVAPTPTRTSDANCGAAPNTPGGADPWGGCWPGPDNTGVPAGTGLTTYTKVLSDGACMITANTVIIDKSMKCQIIVNSGNLTLEDSSVTGEVYNYGSGSVLIKDTTMNGGSDHTETVLGSNITIENSNLYGNQHEVYCGSNCTIENSWLHDNYNFGSSGHENGFLTTGGQDYDLQHNTVDCVGGCTGDITFLGSDSVATVNQNLLVATLDAAYCIYPWSGGGPSIVNQMTITNNVFQRGSNGKCAYYGPVYGWDAPNNNPGTSGYHNLWSGNVWDNGAVLEP